MTYEACDEMSVFRESQLDEGMVDKVWWRVIYGHPQWPSFSYLLIPSLGVWGWK